MRHNTTFKRLYKKDFFGVFYTKRKLNRNKPFNNGYLIDISKPLTVVKQWIRLDISEFCEAIKKEIYLYIGKVYINYNIAKKVA